MRNSKPASVTKEVRTMRALFKAITFFTFTVATVAVIAAVANNKPKNHSYTQ